MSNPTTNRLGEVIAEAMHEAGISENQAALRSGISRQTLRRRLAGGNFTATELVAIASILDTRASRLYARAEETAA
jgi:transcriptional regulator with XRE-family HTH domain